MMLVRVNLLPAELAQRERARRVNVVTTAGVLLFVVLLGGLYVLKLGEISEAESERDAVRGEVDRLEAEVAQLEQYGQLAQELDARNVLLAEAMAPEISYARVLNDLALSFPASSSLRTLEAGATDPTTAAPASTVGESVAFLRFGGYSVERYAPGVEAVLVEFDKVPVFFNSYLATAGVEEIGDTDVTAFDGTVQLDADVFTGRYADGLPEGEAP